MAWSNSPCITINIYDNIIEFDKDNSFDKHFYN